MAQNASAVLQNWTSITSDVPIFPWLWTCHCIAVIFSLRMQGRYSGLNSHVIPTLVEITFHIFPGSIMSAILIGRSPLEAVVRGPELLVVFISVYVIVYVLPDCWFTTDNSIVANEDSGDGDEGQIRRKFITRVLSIFTFGQDWMRLHLVRQAVTDVALLHNISPTLTQATAPGVMSSLSATKLIGFVAQAVVLSFVKSSGMTTIEMVLPSLRRHLACYRCSGCVVNLEKQLSPVTVSMTSRLCGVASVLFSVVQLSAVLNGGCDSSNAGTALALFFNACLACAFIHRAVGIDILHPFEVVITFILSSKSQKREKAAECLAKKRQ